MAEIYNDLDYQKNMGSELKRFLCPRCHEPHGPPEICGISAEYCPKCCEEMRTTGYTLQEVITGSQNAKKMLDEGKVPIEGTTKEDYMIVGDMAIYTPYIPLYQTCLPPIQDL